MQYTENLELPLFETDDAVDLFTTYNAAMTTLDEAVEEKATSAEVDAVEQIATTAGATATQAQADATAAGTAAAAAQADATAAGTAAAAAQADATAAGTAATAAAALAQQAIAAGIKVKKLSSTEIQNILSLAGNGGILTYTGVNNIYDSYVINLTPRIKLLSASLSLSIRPDTFTLNTKYRLRYLNSFPITSGAIFSIVPNFDASVEITSNTISSGTGSDYYVTFNGSATLTSDSAMIVALAGFVWYNSDIDLGTDITQ